MAFSSGDYSITDSTQSTGIFYSQFPRIGTDYNFGGNSALNINTISDQDNTTIIDCKNASSQIELKQNTKITGDLEVAGTTTTVSSTALSIADVNILVGSGNSADICDLGLYGLYNDGTSKYSGLFRDCSDSGTFKLFKGLTVSPTTVVDTDDASFSLADLEINDLTLSSILVTKADNANIEVKSINSGGDSSVVLNRPNTSSYAQMLYKTNDVLKWGIGMRTGDPQYFQFYDGITSTVNFYIGPTGILFNPAVSTITHVGATSLDISSTSGTVNIESCNFNGNVLSGVSTYSEFLDSNIADRTAGGTHTTINTSDLKISDASIKICDGNTTANLIDPCFYSTYNDGTQRYAGLFNDASDSNTWKLFKTDTEPSTTVDTGDATYSLQNLDLDTLTCSTLTDGTFTVAYGAITGLSSINSNIISDTQWGYVSNLNQALTTTSNVKFNTLSLESGNRVNFI